ncbi:flagellar hook protein FlgE [Noviherbaspirillum galbum]|uniref:Flagellar hook protein FlgE n=1 Tax=Noviherbaspirillum galbum TaxID=2709383 RepID=A0A6B3SQ87_9BURK|nr:flagellar hook protein FlgE [Noviherbaspirillum galbum]NEX62678.1 flagellar hook protein FlgE [Noviherbaspirillum galbum]
MSFQQGLSGLNGASKTLETIGNNLANSNTAGFKSSQVQFADMYANSLSGSGAASVGIGTQVSRIAQQFTQGNINASTNPLDMAINGNGFFGVQMPDGSQAFSRNGQFQLDQSGFVVTATGQKLMGYVKSASGSEQIQPLVIDMTKGYDPKATVGVSMALNLDSRNTVPTTTFDPANPTAGGFNSTSSCTVYDSKGVPHVVQAYFVKAADGWDVYAQSDVVIPPATAPDAAQLLTTSTARSLTFDQGGKLTTTMSPAPTLTFQLDPASGATGADAADAGLNQMTVKLDFTNTTEYGAPFSVNGLAQNGGYSAGRLSGFSIGSDGTVLGRYTNGQTQSLGQVALYGFRNVNGLQPVGNNTWVPTSPSDAGAANKPGTGGLGVIQSASIEESNVDMTAELVNMITAQRVYQANAQTIKTQDQVLQTLVNLR